MKFQTANRLQWQSYCNESMGNHFRSLSESNLSNVIGKQKKAPSTQSMIQQFFICTLCPIRFPTKTGG